jgi:hypothetical protein
VQARGGEVLPPAQHLADLESYPARSVAKGSMLAARRAGK